MSSSRMDAQLREVALAALAATDRPVAGTDPALARLAELGTSLWLDTGNLEEAASLWKREFSALTTNNTLANQVVQTGVLDDIARAAVRELRAGSPGISGSELIMELGFVINCHVALRLVKAFGAYVSVELHPAVAADRDRTVEYAMRYYAVCPERFIIKIPLTPEGYCAVARVCRQGVPVNYTLGFSARQNYLAALVSDPTYCNVFLGRLNAVVSDNKLGDGRFVGERASMATQVALMEGRRAGRTGTKLIAASMRAASQVADLAGTDVYTMPPKVARDFMTAAPDPGGITSQVGRDFPVTVNAGVDPSILAPLWDISDRDRAATEQIVAQGGVNVGGDDLRQADSDHGAGLFHRFTDAEVQTIRTDGKIPVLSKWERSGAALDDLMTQCALQSFAIDQGALDGRLGKLASEA